LTDRSERTDLPETAEEKPPEVESAGQPPPRLELREIVKSFGATRALDGVDLRVRAGEVHAIIGENGAGKSTLMKVLSGAHQPDRGEILLDGRPLRRLDPRESLRAGIAMIYQELNLAPELTVAQNIHLGSEPNRFGWVHVRRQRDQAVAALEKLDCQHIPLDRPVGSLSVANQQMVEIARAIQATLSTTDETATDGEANEAGHLKLLILDEPTSSLTKWDTERLFAVIDRLRRQGVSVLYISHFLEECQQVASRYTVLRDGRSIDTGSLSEQPLEAIIHAMVGRELADLYPPRPAELQENEPRQPVLRLKQVRGSGLKKPTGPQTTSQSENASGVTLTLHRGEIVGLAGLIGAGRTECIRALFGLDRLAAGTVTVGDQASSNRLKTARQTDRHAWASWQRDSIGLVSENRKDEGLLLQRSLMENLTLTRLKPYYTFRQRIAWLKDGKAREATVHWMKELSVKASGPDQPIGSLSGGNQQKIALGRLLHHDCDILLLDEPTRGIDIGSKRTVYRTIRKLADQGKSVLMVSSYLPELLGVCDRVGVICRGDLVAMRPVDQWTEHELLTAAIGQAISDA